MIKSIVPARDGYTLVELLIAVTLLGIVTAPLITLFTTASSWTANARCRSAALNLCRERIEELRSAGCGEVTPFNPNGHTFPVTEDEIPGHPGFRRQTTILPQQLEWGIDPPIHPEVFLIEVTVSWELGGREHSETLFCYLLAP